MKGTLSPRPSSPDVFHFCPVQRGRSFCFQPGHPSAVTPAQAGVQYPHALAYVFGRAPDAGTRRTGSSAFADDDVRGGGTSRVLQPPIARKTMSSNRLRETVGLEPDSSGRVPGIHDHGRRPGCSWIAGTSPAMTPEWVAPEHCPLRRHPGELARRAAVPRALTPALSRQGGEGASASERFCGLRNRWRTENVDAANDVGAYLPGPPSALFPSPPWRERAARRAG